MKHIWFSIYFHVFSWISIIFHVFSCISLLKQVSASYQTAPKSLCTTPYELPGHVLQQHHAVHRAARGLQHALLQLRRAGAAHEVHSDAQQPQGAEAGGVQAVREAEEEQAGPDTPQGYGLLLLDL